jgi:hypothetical protein
MGCRKKMEDYKKDIIMVYHIPVDDLSRQRAEEQIYQFSENFTTNDFYREYFLPYTGGEEKIVKIEIINLKGIKTEKIDIKLDEIDERLMKYFEHDKWLRLKKLQKIIK